MIAAVKVQRSSRMAVQDPLAAAIVIDTISYFQCAYVLFSKIQLKTRLTKKRWIIHGKVDSYR